MRTLASCLRVDINNAQGDSLSRKIWVVTLIREAFLCSRLQLTWRFTTSQSKKIIRESRICSAEWNISITPPLPKIWNHCRRGGKVSKSQRQWMATLNQFYFSRHSVNCTYELIAVVWANTRTPQAQYRQSPSMERRETEAQSPSLAKEILATDSC